MSADYESEVAEMCNLSDGVYNNGKLEGMKEGIMKGMKEGRMEGIKEGQLEAKLNSVKSLMSTTGATLEKAMDMLQITGEEREYITNKI